MKCLLICDRPLITRCKVADFNLDVENVLPTNIKYNLMFATNKKANLETTCSNSDTNNDDTIQRFHLIVFVNNSLETL